MALKVRTLGEYKEEMRRLDQEALKDYDIGLAEYIRAVKYANHLQEGLPKKCSCWEIGNGGNGDHITRTANLIYLVVQDRALQNIGIDLLRSSPEDAREILGDHNDDVHNQAHGAKFQYLMKKTHKLPAQIISEYGINVL